MKFKHVMYTKSLYLIILLLISFSAPGWAQKKFEPVWLNQPQKFITELESCFDYNETDKYAPKESINLCFLRNGYAKSEFENPEEWIPGVINRNVKEITIVFSKYPYFKDDWITNYHLLLSNRLKHLFELDPSLNSSKINWSLLVQTSCKTEEDALKLLHGIEIKSEYFKLDDNIKNSTASENKIRPEKDQQIIDERKDVVPEQYWEFYYQQEKQFEQSKKKYKSKKQKKKRRKAPSCPDFSEKKRRKRLG